MSISEIDREFADYEAAVRNVHRAQRVVETRRGELIDLILAQPEGMLNPWGHSIGDEEEEPDGPAT